MSDRDGRHRDQEWRYDEDFDPALDELWPPRPTISPGKRTLTQGLPPVQRSSTPTSMADDPDVHGVAAAGVSGSGGPLPYLEAIQRSFGHHDVSGVRAHVSGESAAAAAALGARAYATGNDVAFSHTPDLHLAAHEAAHIVQQRGGVHLSSDIGHADDEYERHADAVADAVVAGRSAERLLDEAAPSNAAPGGGQAPIQRQVDPALLERNIAEMRTENLMVLYVDALGGTTHELYRPPSGSGTRRAYDTRFLRRPSVRRLLLSRFRGQIDYGVEQRRWDALYWLHSEFPPAHLPNAAARPLAELTGYIERTARAVPEGHGTGWDQIQATPSRREGRAAEAAEGRAAQSAAVRDAVGAVGAGLRRASGQALHRIVFSTPGMRALGGHTHGQPSNWASALSRYIITLNQLRQGRPAAGGGIRGAPQTATSHVVDAATQTWQQLSESTRQALANTDAWAEVVRGVWPVYLERAAWGFEQAGANVNIDTLDGGRWRNPSQAMH
jgi:hypothetical protein